MSLFVKNSGTWREVGPTGLYVRDSSQWKPVKEGFVKDGGSWKRFFIQSDPVTNTYYPNWSWAYQGGGSPVDYTIDVGWDDGFLITGSWPAPTNNAQSFLGFKNRIASDLAVRPVVKAARIRLTSLNASEADGNIHWYFGTFVDSGSQPGTAPSPPKTQAVIQQKYTTVWHTLNGTIVGQIAARGGISMVANAGEAQRGYFRGYLDTTTVRPVLELTLDYA